MNNLNVRVVIVLVLLALAAAVSALTLYPKRMDRGSLKAARLPLRLDSWTGREEPIEDYVKAILETDDVIQRTYQSPRWSQIPVVMAVVFSADNRRVAHPPEVCYRGAGWEVAEKKIVEVEGLPPLVRLVLSGGANNKDMVFYCYKAGDQITANYYRQQYNIAVNQIRRKATSSALIRFSSPVVDGEENTARRLSDFMRLMMPEIRRTLNE